MNARWQEIVKGLAGWGSLAAAQRERLIAQLEHMPFPGKEEAAALISALGARYELPPDSQPEPAGSRSEDPEESQAWEHVLVAAGGLLGQAGDGSGTTAAASDTGSAPAAAELAARYRTLGNRHATRYQLLQILAMSGDRTALAEFAALVAEDPPPRGHDAALAFAPLFRNEIRAVDVLFPRLFDALQHESVAALVLDLANHLMRTRRVRVHPARSRAAMLAGLFGQLVERLKRVEEKPAEFAKSPAELSDLIARSVALGTALADTLGLIGNPEVADKLRQAFLVGHRRLRAEAAAALGRLEQEDGFEVLASLAADPGTRIRALAYLEELGQLPRAAEADRSPAARAEGELAAWLAQPTQFGLPPTALELVDARVLHWPGYDEVQECHLFRYRYDFPRGTLRGIGIAGPVTHCLHVDLEDLPPLDIYAAYCGWHTEHDELSETPAELLADAERAALEPLLENLRMAGYEDLELIKLGLFFGRPLPVFTATRAEQSGVLICDEDERDWHPLRLTRRPLGPTEAYYIHIGRRILQTFNDSSMLPPVDG